MIQGIIPMISRYYRYNKILNVNKHGNGINI